MRSLMVVASLCIALAGFLLEWEAPRIDPPATRRVHSLSAGSDMRECHMLIGDQRLKVDSIVWGVTKDDLVGIAMLTGTFEDGSVYESVNLESFVRLLESTDDFVGLRLPVPGSTELARVEQYELVPDERGDLILSCFVGVIENSKENVRYIATAVNGWPDCCKWRMGVTGCVGGCSVPCPEDPKLCACFGEGYCVGQMGTICAGNCNGPCNPGQCVTWTGSMGNLLCGCRGS